MKRNLFLAVLLLAVMALAVPATVAAQTAPTATPVAAQSMTIPGQSGQWIVTYQQGMILRDGPMTSAKQMSTVQNGFIMTVTEVVPSEQQVWLKLDGGQYVQAWDGESRAWNVVMVAPSTMIDAQGQLVTFDYQTYWESLTLATDDDSPQTLIRHMNQRFDLTDENEAGVFPGQRGAWSPEDLKTIDVTVEGPALVWTDFFKAGNVPAGVQPLSVAGFWGVYFVPVGISATLPKDTDGGRWVSLTYLPETIAAQGLPSLGQGGGSSCPAFDAVVLAVTGKTPQETTQYMDSNPLETTRYMSNDNSTVIVEEGQVAIIWRDWGEQGPPEGVTALTTTSTEGGFGAWTVSGPATINGVTNGGVTLYTCAEQPR